MFPYIVVVFVSLWAIQYAVYGWHEATLVFPCTYLVLFVGFQTWRAPRWYSVGLSDTEVGGGRWYFGKTRRIPLADLDRVRSARRSRIDRILGQQHLYSTNGTRLYIWRASFAGSDFRKLLDLLQLGGAATSPSRRSMEG
jgi:hypothetical protein